MSRAPPDRGARERRRFVNRSLAAARARRLGRVLGRVRLVARRGAAIGRRSPSSPPARSAPRSPLIGATPWRRVFIGGGFPLSFAVSGAAALPPWAWLLPLALLAFVYPVARLARRAALPDAGRRAARPRARRAARPPARRCSTPAAASARRCSSCAANIRTRAVDGIEWSWPLLGAGAPALPLRARAARRHLERRLVGASRSSICSSGRRAWPRAAAKAARELKPGRLAGEPRVRDRDAAAAARARAARDGRRVWLYRAPFRSAD